MSRTHAESHRRIKLISTEIDRLLTKLRALDEGDAAQALGEVMRTAQTSRAQPELHDWALFLEHHAHLIARGGALALLQSSVGLAGSSLVTLAAEEWALGRSWKVNWMRRTQRPHAWAPGHQLRAFDVEGYRPAAWRLLGKNWLFTPSAPGTSHAFRLQHVVDGGVVAEAPSDRRGIEAALQLADQSLLLANDDGSLQRWTLEPLAQQARLPGHQGAVLSLQASADGLFALSYGADGALCFWSTSPLKKLATLALTGSAPRVIALSPGASYAITGHTDGRVELHPTGDRGKHKILLGHRAPVERIVALKGLLITSDNRGEIRCWTMPTGEPLRELAGHRAPVGFLWVDPERKTLLSSASDGSLARWSLEDGASLASFTAVGDGVLAACALAEGRVALGSADGSVRLLDAQNVLSPVLGYHDGPVTGLAPVDSDAVLSLGLDRAARLWLIHQQQAPAPRAVLGLDADGLRAACVTGGETEIFDFAEGRRIRKISLEEHTSLVPLLEHGRLLLDTAPTPLPPFHPAPGRHTLRLLDAEQGATLHTLEGHRGLVRAAAVDDRQRWLATGDADGEVKLWDFSTGASLLTLRGSRSPVLALAFEPSGIELYALHLGNEVCTWSTRSGKLMRRVPLQYAPDEPLTQLQAAGERELLMAGRGGEIGRWDAESGKRIKGWRAHACEIRALGYDAEDDLLATGGDDRRVKLWKRSSGKLLAQYDMAGSIAGCRFLPDGRLAAFCDRGEPHYLKFIDWAQDD